MLPRDTNIRFVSPRRFRKRPNDIRPHFYPRKTLDEKRREICVKYLKQECPYGPMCHRIHIDPSDEEFHDVGTVSVNPPPAKLIQREFLRISHTHDPLIQEDPIDAPTPEKHPHPKSNEICWAWEHDWCHLGFDCDFVHGDLQYDSPVPEIATLPDEEPETEGIRYPRPRNNATCVYWLRGYCHRGPTCPWFHGDVNYEDPPDWPLPDEGPVNQLLHPRPPRNETCRAWRRGLCQLGYDCKYIHEDLVYDDPIPGIHIPLAKPIPLNSQPDRTPLVRSEWTQVVHDHIRVKLGSGFDILEITTGFETPWLFVDQLPVAVTESNILNLLSLFGKVEIKAVSRNAHFKNVKAKYANYIDARNACTSLDNTKHFGAVIRAQLSVNTTVHGGMLKDCTVRVNWQAPSLTAYGGYPSIALAEEAILIARKPFQGHQLRAQLYEGLPAVGLYTVKFWNLPAGIKNGDMKIFAEPTGIVWERLPYTSVNDVARSIRRMITQNLDLLTWDMASPPYHDGLVRVYARFATPAKAAQAARLLHLRKPPCIGGRRIFANHLKELSFKLTASSYERIRSDVAEFRASVDCRCTGSERLSGVTVLHYQNDTVLVKLFSDDLKDLGCLKSQFEKIRQGETAMFEGKVAWDNYFGLPVGIVFLDGLQRRNPDLLIHRDSIARRLVLHGPSSTRASAQQDIVAKLKDLRQRQTRIVPIPGSLLGFIASSVYPELKRELGEEVVSVDLWHRNLIVRGTADQWATAKRAVQNAATMTLDRRKATVECPICFDEVASPCTFRCGHKHCRSCLKEYLLAAQDSCFFPLTCLGNEASCTELIPLAAAKEFLTARELDGLVTAAYSAYIAKRPNEFHPCPTPDCPQVYRVGPAGNILQCPACLARICSTCHSEEHEGVECPDSDRQEQEFKEWKSQHDVKACPGCKVNIERAEGCNHVTCTQCQTHICWVCSTTFPRGEGIYNHIRTVHGDIGVF